MATPTFDQAEFSSVTTGCPSGSGVFDQLMKSVKAHLKEEYDSQRIRGSEYTQVYLGGMQAAMSQAIQWQLGAQIAANQALLIEKQYDNLDKQGELIQEQIDQIIAQTELTVQQKTNLIAEALNIPKQGDILDAQESQIAAQTGLVTQQALTEEQNTASTQYNVESMLPAQKAILDQKLITEEAQTKDTTVQGAVAGAIGKKNALVAKQTDGFDRDAEQKASRAIFDSWGMAIGSDIAGEAVPTELSKDNIDEVIRQLRLGAGINGDV